MYEYYKAMYGETHSLMRRDTCYIILRKSFSDKNVLPGTFSFKCKRKPYWTISKFKARYFMRGGVQKRLSTELLNLGSILFQWATVRLMFILHCIIYL